MNKKKLILRHRAKQSFHIRNELSKIVINFLNFGRPKSHCPFYQALYNRKFPINAIPPTKFEITKTKILTSGFLQGT